MKRFPSWSAKCFLGRYSCGPHGSIMNVVLESIESGSLGTFTHNLTLYARVGEVVALAPTRLLFYLPFVLCRRTLSLSSKGKTWWNFRKGFLGGVVPIFFCRRQRRGQTFANVKTVKSGPESASYNLLFILLFLVIFFSGKQSQKKKKKQMSQKGEKINQNLWTEKSLPRNACSEAEF